jgi:putative transposase
VSKSATSRRFVALSAARMKEWMVSDLGHLDIMVVQIDGIHIAEDIVLVARSASTARAQSIHSG